jgi:hypothetical protein
VCFCASALNMDMGYSGGSDGTDVGEVVDLQSLAEDLHG